jgi:hypothetical protein
VVVLLLRGRRRGVWVDDVRDERASDGVLDEVMLVLVDDSLPEARCFESRVEGATGGRVGVGLILLVCVRVSRGYQSERGRKRGLRRNRHNQPNRSRDVGHEIQIKWAKRSTC